MSQQRESPARWKDQLWDMLTRRFDAIDVQLAAQAFALDKLVDAAAKLENHLMKQDEAMKALQDANTALKAIATTAFAQLSAAFANIKADEEAIIAKLATLGDLTPANQAIVDAVIADSQALGASIQAQADAAKTVADSIPDAPVVVQVEP